MVSMLDLGAGLVAEPTTQGRLLTATNRRLIYAATAAQTRETEMFAAESIVGSSVRERHRRGVSWLQGLSMVVGASLVYLILAYWLVDRLPGPVIPVINLHVAALALLALTVVGLVLIWRIMSYSQERIVRVTGTNWALEMPTGAPLADLIGFGNAMMELRNQQVGTEPELTGGLAGVSPSP